MQIIQELTLLKKIIKDVKKDGLSIGFVPTMGFLHEGHLSLMRTAKAENDFMVMSIFVNPLQFGVGEDYEDYPRDLERDEKLARSVGCDLMFLPSAKEMYPAGYATFVKVEKLTERLCGASRPGHFIGVTTVVAKLFNLVSPDRAYFGQKDAQQAFVLRKMVQDLNMDLNLIILPTTRESDGLAMSSRNKYLTFEQRKNSVVIIESLKMAEELADQGVRNVEEIKKAIYEKISKAKDARIDYLEIVDTEKLLPLTEIKGQCLIAAAVKFGKTRLIDNIILEV
ncbi:MAG: pantoate--beta-alanine ligase [Bacillota bacterium]|nr:pantoate--beta-alanine ligase [Bacillota bacterium]